MTAAISIAPLKAAGEDAVAIQYHFAGAANLSGDTNFDTAREIFKAPTSTNFETFVLNRLARVFWEDLKLDPQGKPVELLGPILDVKHSGGVIP